ncbi:hypothetical protein GCM10029964_055870 [Kibdelosporangium lantanae]
MIQQALANAGLSAADVDAVEAHGTGTPLGDPIEAQALLATYGQQRDEPLWLGSIKSNIGHTQSAAGIAGVIKMVEALRHEVLPATLHVDEPTTRVDWSAGAVRLLAEQVPWPRSERTRRAGVSAFGFSGTNAHVILEEAGPSPDVTGVATMPVVPWVLSARTAAALRARAGDIASFADSATARDIGASLVTGKSTFTHRAVVLGRNTGELAAGSTALADDRPAPDVVSGVAGDPGKTVFVFGGQGSQWTGMARELVDAFPVFAEALVECDAALAPHLGWSVRDLLAGTAGTPSLDRDDVVQPALFAVMVSLARLWSAVGVRPAAVVGHSQGEIAAACVAGALSLSDAARLVVLRSQVLTDLAGGGAMGSVAIGVAETRSRVGHRPGLGVAAVNGPTSVVVSGPVEVVDGFLAECAADGIRTRRVPINYASHSAQVEQIRDRVLAVARHVRPAAGEVTFVSTVSGEPVAGTALDAEYWYRNLREAVVFEDAVRGLLDAGFRAFVEISPHPVLSADVAETMAATGHTGVVVASLRRHDGTARRFLRSVAEAHVAGVSVDWAKLFGSPHAPAVTLPTYPFERRRFDLGHPDPVGTDPRALGLSPVDHPMLHAATDLPDGGRIHFGRITLAGHQWLADHSVRGAVLVPGAALVEVATAVGADLGCPVVDELTLEAPVVVPRHGGVTLRVTVGTLDDTGRRPVWIHTRTADDGPWDRPASGFLAPEPVGDPRTELVEWPPGHARPVDVSDAYVRLNERGYGYGHVFQGVTKVWQHDTTLFAEVSLPTAEHVRATGFRLHPALLDAALHPAGLVLDDTDRDQVSLPFCFSGVRFHRQGATCARVRISPATDGGIAVVLADDTGQPIASVASLISRPVGSIDLGVAVGELPDALFRVAWEPVSTGTAGGWHVLSQLGGSPLVGAGVHSDLSAVAGEPSVPDTLVLPVPPTPPGADPGARVRAVLAVLQEWLTEPRFADGQLIVATVDADHDPGGSAVRGLVRSAMSEHPDRFGLIDVDVLDDVVVRLGLSAGQPQCVVRGGSVLVPKLVRAHRATTPAPPDWGGGTVLVTGGLSGAGAVVAQHIAATGSVRGLLLVGRRGADTPGSDELARDLARLDVEVSVLACDVADRAALADAIASIPPCRPLTGVVHAAGVLADGTIESLTDTQVDKVFRPKVAGAWHLHELTADMDLSAFVVFSSAAACLGGPGQGNYAAANSWLEWLARYRRRTGLPATAVAWGPWSLAGGMADRLSNADRGRQASRGYCRCGTNRRERCSTRPWTSTRRYWLPPSPTPYCCGPRRETGC